MPFPFGSQSLYDGDQTDYGAGRPGNPIDPQNPNPWWNPSGWHLPGFPALNRGGSPDNADAGAPTVSRPGASSSAPGGGRMNSGFQMPQIGLPSFSNPFSGPPQPPQISAPFQDSQTAPAAYHGETIAPPGSGGAGEGQDYLDAATASAKAEARQKAAEAAYNEQRAQQLQQQLARSADPNSVENQTAQAQLATAQAQAAKSQQELAQIKNSLTPEQQIRLTDSLARDRDRLNAEVQQRQRDAEALQRQQEQERQNQYQAGRDERQNQYAQQLEQQRNNNAIQLWNAQKELRLTELTMGQQDKAADRAMRQQELDYQHGRDAASDSLARDRLAFDKDRAAQDYQLRLLSQKVAEGELSAKKAFDQFQMKIQKERLPSEIARNKSEAYAPFLPYLTDMKDGDIPMGFESGGPMQRLVEMGGGHYDPGTYAVHPVSIKDIQGGNLPTRAAPSAPPSAGAASVPMPHGTTPSAEVINRIKQRLG